MTLLALHIVFNVGFALSTRVAQFRRYDYFLVAAVNYSLAAVVASLWALLRGGWGFDAPTLIFGAVQGFQYAATMIGVYLLLVRSGVGVTFIVLRLTVVVPTLSAIVFFGERPSPAAIGGLLLMLISIPLLVGPRSAVRGPRSRWYWPSVALMMIVTGAGLTASKAFNELSTPDRAPDFVMFSFLVSVPVALVIFAMRRRFQARTPPAQPEPLDARSAGNRGSHGPLQRHPAGFPGGRARTHPRHHRFSNPDLRLGASHHRRRRHRLARTPRPHRLGRRRRCPRRPWSSSTSERRPPEIRSAFAYNCTDSLDPVESKLRIPISLG